jgi:hypothetical protein
MGSLGFGILVQHFCDFIHARVPSSGHSELLRSRTCRCERIPPLPKKPPGMRSFSSLRSATSSLRTMELVGPEHRHSAPPNETPMFRVPVLVPLLTLMSGDQFRHLRAVPTFSSNCNLTVLRSKTPGLMHQFGSRPNGSGDISLNLPSRTR